MMGNDLPTLQKLSILINGFSILEITKVLLWLLEVRIQIT